MATKIAEPKQDGEHYMLPYSQSNGISNYLYKDIKKDIPNGHNYWINEGRVINFDHEDPTIASLQYASVHEANHTHLVENDQFDPYVFNSQFMKYVQVLDTDYDNYILLYSCQENAEFREMEGGAELSPEDVWTLSEKNH